MHCHATSQDVIIHAKQSETLCTQVSTQLYVHAAGNELLNYLKGLEADAVKSLTVVSEDGVEAMKTFIHRLLGNFCIPNADCTACHCSVLLLCCH